MSTVIVVLVINRTSQCRARGTSMCASKVWKSNTSVFIDWFILNAYPATCRLINGKANAIHPDASGMMVNYADFNVGFQPTVWKQICKAIGKPIFQPLEEAIELLKPDANFVQQSSRLAYTEGDMWFYLKAEEQQDCKTLLEVRI